MALIDLIRRADAIQEFGEYLMMEAQQEYAGTASEDIEDWKDLAEHILRDIPSVEPRRLEITAAEVEKLLALGWTIHTLPEKGEWLFVGNSIEAEWECSECGEKEFGSKSSLTNFCPNCGADMRKGANDENNQRMDQ